MDKLPTEITLIISAHLPFETYIQYSQTCRAIQHSLSSSGVINYLNNRFNFGHGNHTGALLLFAFHNILKIPEKIREIVLEHFIVAYQNDNSFIRGWSLIHAVICANPGRFLELLEKDKGKKLIGPLPLFDAKKRKLLVDQQRLFAKKMYRNIIVSSIPHKLDLRSSKTYQAIFTNLLHAGDLSTVEQCLRVLGPPRDSIILSETDFNEKCPLTNYSGNITINRKRKDSEKEEEYDIPEPVDVICKNDQYLDFSPSQMRLLARQLLQAYHAKITFYPTSYCSRSIRSKHHYGTSTATTTKHRRRDFL